MPVHIVNMCKFGANRYLPIITFIVNLKFNASKTSKEVVIANQQFCTTVYHDGACLLFSYGGGAYRTRDFRFSNSAKTFIFVFSEKIRFKTCFWNLAK